MEGQADPQHAAGDAGTCTLRGRDQRGRRSHRGHPRRIPNGAVYDAIVKRYGIQGKLFTFVSKLRGGMRNNIGLELKVAESETG